MLITNGIGYVSEYYANIAFSLCRDRKMYVTKRVFCAFLNLQGSHKTLSSGIMKIRLIRGM